MEKQKYKILSKYRLRPQRKGKLPNFTKDFQNFSQKINHILKNKVQCSFQFNKFGIQKRRKRSNLCEIGEKGQQKIGKKSDQQSILRIHELNGCEKHLKYNETRISPDHKIKIREKSSKKLNRKSQSEQLGKFIKLTEDRETEKLPKINLTSRSMVGNKQNLTFGSCQTNTKSGILSQSKTARVYNKQHHTGKNSYNKLYHIVTMGRKQISSQF